MRDISINLRRASVQPSTVSRYASAISFFMNYLFVLDIVLGPTPSEAFLDETVADYIQWMFSENLPKFQSNLIFAAIRDLFPRCHLATVRRVIKAWDRIEPSTSAFPCPWLYCVFVLYETLIGSNFGVTASFEFKLQLGITVSLLFLGLFRPAEIRYLKRLHVSLGPSPNITVRVRGKTEIRHNRPAVAVTIKDAFLHMLLSALLAIRGDGLFDFHDNSFGRFCQSIFEHFPMFPRLTPYSFKRGGASELFRRTGSFDVCVEQGRWQDVSSARRYIETATADQMIFELTPVWRTRMLHARDELRLFAERGGMVGSSRLLDEETSI